LGRQNGGVIFSCDKNNCNSTYSVLYRFDGWSGVGGSWPFDSLVLDNEKLYGMTYQGGNNNSGVIFSCPKDNCNKNTYSVIYHFPFYSNPRGSLINVGNILYGMTWEDGIYRGGTIFSCSKDDCSGTYDVLHTFKPWQDGSSPGGSLVYDSPYLLEHLCHQRQIRIHPLDSSNETVDQS